MALGRQAKMLSRAQVDATLGYLATTRHPERNRVVFLLSVKAGLRAKEIANLTWEMVSDAEGWVGTAIALTNDASKGRTGGRTIPINRDLRAALIALKQMPRRTRASDYVVTTERLALTSAQAVVNLFSAWYRAMGFVGCSSHSGRRTFVTNAARKISTVGGSLRDVQFLAGHSNLSTTQRYIDYSAHAQARVVQVV